MPDEFVSLREFDGFADSMRNEFRCLSDQIVQVSTKIDGLNQLRIEEARVMGEITSTIKAINDRLDHQEAERAEMQAEIDGLWQEHANVVKSKLGWVGQLVALVLAAVAGGLIARVK